MINENNQPTSRKRSTIVIKKATIIELLILLIAASILILVVFSFNVNAQELATSATAKISIEKEQIDDPSGLSQILDLTVFENWYSEIKTAAFTCFTLHTDFPSMCFHQTFGNSEAQP